MCSQTRSGRRRSLRRVTRPIRSAAVGRQLTSLARGFLRRPTRRRHDLRGLPEGHPAACMAAELAPPRCATSPRLPERLLARRDSPAGLAGRRRSTSVGLAGPFWRSVEAGFSGKVLGGPLLSFRRDLFSTSSFRIGRVSSFVVVPRSRRSARRPGRCCSGCSRTFCVMAASSSFERFSPFLQVGFAARAGRLDRLLDLRRLLRSGLGPTRLARRGGRSDRLALPAGRWRQPREPLCGQVRSAERRMHQRGF